MPREPVLRSRAVVHEPIPPGEAPRRGAEPNRSGQPLRDPAKRVGHRCGPHRGSGRDRGVVREETELEIHVRRASGTPVDDQDAIFVRMDVQIFGVKNNADVRKAERFFKERRVKIHFMDFKQRNPSKGELRRFFQKFGEQQLIDRASKRFRALGLNTAYYGEDRWIEIACDEPMMLRQPLVRSGNHLSVGPSEAEWREWVG